VSVKRILAYGGITAVLVAGATAAATAGADHARHEHAVTGVAMPHPEAPPILDGKDQR
jgi:predicted dienelactone hydrolase